MAESYNQESAGYGEVHSDIQNDKTKNLPLQKGDIFIEVTNPITKDEKFSKYTLYTIKGADKEGDFEVVRRYSDFEKIRHTLAFRWPGVHIPSLPLKQSMNNMEAKFIEERRRGLDEFVKKIAETSFLHYAEEYQVFIRSGNPDMEKALAIFQKEENSDLITRYTSTFAYLSGKDLTNETTAKISTFSLYLTKVKGYFENYKNISKRIALARKAYYEQLAVFHEAVCEPYEKNVFSEYQGNVEANNLFHNPSNEKLALSVEQLKEVATRDSLEYICEWIENESREIDAFLETVLARDKYEILRAKQQEKLRDDTETLHKIAAGKTTIKTLFSTKKKEEEAALLEQSIAGLTKSIEDLGVIHDMITFILAYEEIDNFKKQRVEGYYQMVKKCGDNELLNLKMIGDYWTTVLDNPNVKTLESEQK